MVSDGLMQSATYINIDIYINHKSIKNGKNIHALHRLDSVTPKFDTYYK